MKDNMGVAASPPGHSYEPASGLAAIAGSVPNAGTAGALRNAADEMRTEGHNGWPVLCDYAADELDRLERQLREARGMLPAEAADG